MSPPLGILLAAIQAHARATCPAISPTCCRTGGEGGGLLAALRSRSARVDDHVDELFGELGTSRMRIGCDPAGWVGGAQAADAARLHAGDIAGPR